APRAVADGASARSGATTYLTSTSATTEASTASRAHCPPAARPASAQGRHPRSRARNQHSDRHREIEMLGGEGQPRRVRIDELTTVRQLGILEVAPRDHE